MKEKCTAPGSEAKGKNSTCREIFLMCLPVGPGRAEGHLCALLAGAIIGLEMIVPRNVDYTLSMTTVCALGCIGGILLGLWMERLEEKYKFRE